MGIAVVVTEPAPKVVKQARDMNRGEIGCIVGDSTSREGEVVLMTTLGLVLLQSQFDGWSDPSMLTFKVEILPVGSTVTLKVL